MERAIAIGLLSVLTMIKGCTRGVPPIETSTFTTFADWCVNKAGLSPEARRTVDELLRDAETRQCDKAEAVLTSLTTLEFSVEVSYWQRHQPKPIVDVAPLGTLTNLTELDMGWTPIADVAPLANLNNLTKLVANHSQIGDAAPLASL